MVSTKHAAGAILFALGVVALLGSYAVSGPVEMVGGVAAVVLLASGTVLIGAEGRPDDAAAT